MKRYSEETQYDWHDMVEDPDGEWMRADEVLPRIAELEAELAKRVTIEIRPASDIPAFGGYVAPIGDFESPAKIGINFAAIIATVAEGDTAPDDVPKFVLETIYHEVGHALEQWAGLEFSEKRVRALADEFARGPQEAENSPTDGR
jgi:hypothetical protein